MPLPELHYHEIRTTISALHVYLQIVGKIKQEKMPAVSHHEHLALFVSGRGLTTGLMPGGVEISIDILEQVVRLVGTNGRVRAIDLSGTSPHTFQSALTDGLDYLGTGTSLDEASPTAEEEADEYDGGVSRRVFKAWAGIQEALLRFRGGFSGHTGEVTLDWTTMNLGLTLYSGNSAGSSGELDELDEQAFSEEQFSCGFALGDELEPEPYFYAWMHPSVHAIEGDLRPSGAKWDDERSRATLVYRALAPRTDWLSALGGFYESAYLGQAKVARWDLQGLNYTSPLKDGSYDDG